METLRVLFATSEVAPLIKTGGLADVSAALPAALRRIGVDVRLLVPAYPKLLAALSPSVSHHATPVADMAASGADAMLHHPHHRVAAVFSNLPGFPPARLLAAETPSGVPLWAVECAELYQRGGGPYQDDSGRDWPDNALRFGLLSKIAAILGGPNTPLAWRPQLLHCNDWQTGLTPAYLRHAPGSAPSVMTIHNLAFQGGFPLSLATELGLPPSSLGVNGVEYYGGLSFLKAGLYYADHITTVSPTYAKEIQTDALGFGMQGLLTQRRDDLTGILNGIDTEEWNPVSDRHLVKRYDAVHLSAKPANKRALQKKMGLALNPKLPLFGMVSRFTHQKGLDVLLEIAPQLVALPAQLALLGSGAAELQQAALALAHRYPGKIGAYVGFDEALSHLVEAGADIFLMPSRFEPCGLNQMYSQRYGTPPVVHATGGLADSVVDSNAETLADGSASGFVFDGLNAETLLAAVRRAVRHYRDKQAWTALRRNAMAKNFGWEQSAEQYRALYARLIRR